jgi:O-antigen/teichoic acid export membrane protein
VIDVVAQPIYVWLFGLASFGLYAVLWAAVNLIENFADLGMTSSLQRVVPQAKTEAEAVAALRAALAIGVLPCLVLAIAAFLGAAQIAPLVNVAAGDAGRVADAIRIFAWALPLWAFVEIATSALRARRVFGAEIRLRLFWEQVIRLVLAGVFWVASPTILSLFAAHLLSLSITCLLSVRLLSRYYDLRLMFRAQHGGAAAATLRAGLAALPANAVSRLFGDAPPIVLNAMLPGAAGATAAALYTIARKISSVVQLVRTAFAYVLAPLASAASVGGTAQVQPLYAFATRLAFALVVPLGLTMAGGGDAILGLFGRGADAAHAALIVLILARMAEAVFGAAVPVQQVIGGYRAQVLASAVGLAGAALASVPLVSRYGLSGMAAAVSLGFIIAALVPLIQLHRYDRVHPFEPPFARTAWLAVLLALPGLVLAYGAAMLPDGFDIAATTLITLGSIWLSCRVALPLADRQALGGTARKLRLL